jgi:hypothetical protein
LRVARFSEQFVDFLLQVDDPSLAVEELVAVSDTPRGEILYALKLLIFVEPESFLAPLVDELRGFTGADTFSPYVVEEV